MTKTFIAPLASDDPSAHKSATSEHSTQRRLSLRARSRLHMAAGLLRIKRRSTRDEDEFLAEVLRSIRAMSASKQVELRALVDWVEDYDNECRGGK
jgi:two-component sensor histidine kinase